MKIIRKSFLIVFMSITAHSAIAQSSSDANSSEGIKADVPKTTDKVAIAKELANPIANLVSAPFQYNYSRGVGRNQAGSEQTLLFQPVVPLSLSGGDLFILRPIITGARETNVNGFSGYGVANVTIESFYAPYTGSSWIWGVGPYAVSPSGNSGYFGSQQTGAGVTGVVLNRHGPWTYGLLGYQSWSVGGNSAFGTQNNLYGQPFVAYTTKDAWTFTLETQAQYNYDTHRTNNPLYFGIAKLEFLISCPFNLAQDQPTTLAILPAAHPVGVVEV